MKLRNKKNGEIKYLQEVIHRAYQEHKYSSLAELSDEWEDYEELTNYYYITSCGEIAYRGYRLWENESVYDKKRKRIGNYFETKEEAEQAVEKLKAWKRLKNAKFGIDEWRYRPIEAYSTIERDYKTISVHGEIKFSIFGYEDFVDDFKLLFGGDDE